MPVPSKMDTVKAIEYSKEALIEQMFLENVN
jgi:hypothetical protein